MNANATKNNASDHVVTSLMGAYVMRSLKEDEKWNDGSTGDSVRWRDDSGTCERVLECNSPEDSEISSP